MDWGRIKQWWKRQAENSLWWDSYRRCWEQCGSMWHVPSTAALWGTFPACGHPPAWIDIKGCPNLDLALNIVWFSVVLCLANPQIQLLEVWQVWWSIMLGIQCFAMKCFSHCCKTQIWNKGLEVLHCWQAQVAEQLHCVLYTVNSSEWSLSVSLCLHSV